VSDSMRIDLSHPRITLVVRNDVLILMEHPEAISMINNVFSHGLAVTLSLPCHSGAKTAPKGTKKALAMNAKCLICIACVVEPGELKIYT